MLEVPEVEPQVEASSANSQLTEMHTFLSSPTSNSKRCELTHMPKFRLEMQDNIVFELGVDRYVFFRADADTDYYRSSRPITDILNRYTCLV